MKAGQPLTRRTPLRARPRGKGNRGEREIVDILHAHGWTGARRNFGSGSAGGGDVTWGPEGVHLEVKRVERLNVHQAFAQALRDARPTDTPVVAHRRNSGPWLATLPLSELLPLLKLREAA